MSRDAMSRDEMVAVVESFLDCVVSGELDRLPVTPDLTVESPLTPKLSGDAAREYVRAVSAGTKAVRIVQHIVEGDYVATLTENETTNGQLSVFGKFQIEAGRVKDVRVFYNPQQVAAGDSPSLRASTPRAANLGLMRPPLIYLGAIVLGLVVHGFWPQPIAPSSLSSPVGAVSMLAAGVLFAFAVRSFRSAGTPIPGNRPTTTIVRAGPYRFSRNPIYLAFSLLQLGLAFWMNSVGLLLALVPALAVMALVVIPREERYLEARFPSEYRPYRESVRRWL